MLMPNGASGLIAIDYGIHGPSFSVASACASGADGIGMAWMMLRAGMIDAAVTGGAEATICEVGVGAFDRIGAMSRQNDDYSMTPAPFDKNRDGLVIGEGAGVLVLERESTARARGAVILAELAGYAATADAYHVTAPEANGLGGAAAMRAALVSAEINLDQVGYISAHGTGTPMNDAAETRAIKNAFGAELAYKVPVSSTKSMTGHMMGATGALEAIFCVQAVREGILPPTLHYQTPDPECDLDYIPNQAREQKIEVAISNAFGFGGHNAVLVVRKYR
jgi:3-oxoacyl-(acyl-carrier-protein) synthase